MTYLLKFCHIFLPLKSYYSRFHYISFSLLKVHKTNATYSIHTHTFVLIIDSYLVISVYSKLK